MMIHDKNDSSVLARFAHMGTHAHITLNQLQLGHMMFRLHEPCALSQPGKDNEKHKHGSLITV